MTGNLSFGDAFARWDENFLTIGNRAMTRKIALDAGYPRTVSFICGSEFSAQENNLCDCSFFGLNMPGQKETVWHISQPVSAGNVTDPQFDAPHIEVRFSFKEEFQQAEFTRIYRIYPYIAALR